MNVVVVLADRIQFGSRSSDSKKSILFEEPVLYRSSDERLVSFEHLVSSRKQKGSLAILFGPRFAIRYELTEPLSKHKNIQALKFACEEHIPLSAEQVETDVVDNTRFGIAIESALLDTLLEICERHQIEVSHAGLVDLEATQWLLKSGKLNDHSTVVLNSDGGFSVLGIRDGIPKSWDWYPKDVHNEASGKESLNGQLAGLRFSLQCAEQLLILVNVPQTITELLPGNERQFLDSEFTVEEMAARNAIAVTSGRITPFISIQSETYRPQNYLNGVVSFLLMSIAFLLVSASVFLWTQGNHFANQINDAEAKLQQLYKSAVPNGPATSLVSRSLKTRLAEMEQDRSAQGLAESTQAIQQNLHRFLSAMPDDIEFELDSLGIRPPSIAISGIVRDLDYLVAIKARLVDAGFEITTPDLRKKFNMTLIPPSPAGDPK